MRGYLRSKATPDLILDWVDDLEKREISNRTIENGHLAAARSFFEWAVAKRKMASNPASGIRVEVVAKAKNREPYLYDNEASLILSETLRPTSDRASQEWAAARRWVPWICAFSGARVNEITQMRGQDIEKYILDGEDVWVIKITPEAGTVKNRKVREVPLHPQIVEQLPRVRCVPRRRPLFYDPAKKRGGKAGNEQSHKVGEKLAAWVRMIGVSDPEVSPNHGWRHRFNRVARRIEMFPEVRDAIKGHRPRTEGEVYGGDVEWDVMWPAIKRMPRYDVQAPTGPPKSTPARTKATQDRAATRKRSKERAKGAEAAEAAE